MWFAMYDVFIPVRVNIYIVLLIALVPPFSIGKCCYSNGDRGSCLDFAMISHFIFRFIAFLPKIITSTHIQAGTRRGEYTICGRSWIW